MSNPNILVIGNGFDLYHGLKTQYKDFINYTLSIKKPTGTKRIRCICQNNTFIKCFQKLVSVDSSWIDCELEIENIIIMFKKIVSDRDVFLPYPRDKFIKKSDTSLSSGEFEKLSLMKNFVKDTEQHFIEFNHDFFMIYKGINKEKVYEVLRKDLSDFIYVFQYYLETEVLNVNVEKISEQIKQINPDYLINFNYTNTYENYGIQRENVCYIHGSVDEKNIVLGIKDIDEKDIDSIFFKKFFQRIQKHTDIIEWKRFKKIETFNINKIPNGKWSLSGLQKFAITYFFGHSLSNTDGDIIRNIYENSSKISIFYLQNSESTDYEQKVINLIDTLGKEIVIQGMYSGRIEFIPIK